MDDYELKLKKLDIASYVQTRCPILLLTLIRCLILLLFDNTNISLINLIIYAVIALIIIVICVHRIFFQIENYRYNKKNKIHSDLTMIIIESTLTIIKIYFLWKMIYNNLNFDNEFFGVVINMVFIELPFIIFLILDDFFFMIYINSKKSKYCTFKFNQQSSAENCLNCIYCHYNSFSNQNECDIFHTEEELEKNLAENNNKCKNFKKKI